MKSPRGRFMMLAGVGLVVAALGLSGCEPEKKKKPDTATQDKAAAAIMVVDGIETLAGTIVSTSLTPSSPVSCAFGGTFIHSGTFNEGTTGTDPVVTTTTMDLTLVFTNCNETGTVMNGTVTMTANDTTSDYMSGDTTIGINETFGMTNFSVSGPFGAASIASASVTTTGTMAFTANLGFTMNFAFTVAVDGHTCTSSMTESTVQPVVMCN